MSQLRNARKARNAQIRERWQQAPEPLLIRLREPVQLVHEVEASGPGVIPLPAPELHPLAFVMLAARLCRDELV